MFPKSGNKLLSKPSDEDEADYAVAISKALMAEVGNTHVAAKTVMLWTGASERSARHWLNGDYGPGGWHLILLARNSAAVTKTVLRLAGRNSLELALEIAAARSALIRAAAIIDALGAGDGIDQRVAPQR